MKIIGIPEVRPTKPVYIPHPTKWRTQIRRVYYPIYVNTKKKVYRLKVVPTNEETAAKLVTKITAKGSILVKHWKVVKTH